MPITVHTIPEGQREVERLEKLVQEQQETISALSQKALFDAEHHKREGAIDAAKIKWLVELNRELFALLSTAYNQTPPPLQAQLKQKIVYIREKYPEL